MKDNYCVIMGGGIGSRFWPFSRENYPKQFLDLFGSGRTLLQMTFDRFVKIIPLENIYVVTNVAYEALVKEQLPDLPDQQILLEPTRLNTAPCVAYAAYHIRARDPEANIVVAPTDHLIIREDVFLDDVKKGLAFVKEHDALVTLGIKPSRPETGYGYIQSSEQMCGEFTKVKTFTEKPNLEMAKVFRVPWGRRAAGIYLPAVLPSFRAAVSVSLGLCWKAGAAAEVIGLPAGTIGERLYTAKVYFETGDLFAWTAVIVAVSVGFEKLFLQAVDALAGKAGC